MKSRPAAACVLTHREKKNQTAEAARTDARGAINGFNIPGLHSVEEVIRYVDIDFERRVEV